MVESIPTYDLVPEALYTIRAFAGNNPAVSFSGGKDSLVALDLAVRAGIKKAVFSDTTVEFEDTVRYVKTIRQFYGIDLVIARPTRSFFELIEVFGFPSRRSRWCCEALKFGPLGKYALQNGITSFITGLRSEESRKRRGYSLVGNNPVLPIKQVNPLLNWTEEEVWRYLREFSLPINPLYSQGMKRVGCWPCPFKGKRDWELTKKKFPDLINSLNVKIKQICENFSVGIRDIDDFVKTMAWTAHTFTQTSKIAGKMKLDSNRLTISFNTAADLEKTLKLMPTMSNHHHCDGNELTIYDVDDRKRVKVIVEKAINCVGCGACLVLCRNDALSIENGSLAVSPNKCSKCGECLKASKLRGACLRRNYAPVRYQVRSDLTDNDNEDIIEERFSGLCSDSDISGRIRSRVPMQQTLKKILTLGEATRLEETLIVRNNVFMAIFKQNKSFTEVRFRTDKESFATTVEIIRSVLKKPKIPA